MATRSSLEGPTLTAQSKSWTLRLRQAIDRHLPMDHLLPDRQPYYVGSWVYVFGVVTMAALVWVVVSGIVLSFFGPQWWHDSRVGRFFNSLHFWSVQLFFIFMVLQTATGDDVEPARRRPGGRPRRAAGDQRPFLPDRLHTAAPVHGRWQLPPRTGSRCASHRQPVV